MPTQLLRCQVLHARYGCGPSWEDETGVVGLSCRMHVPLLLLLVLCAEVDEVPALALAERSTVVVSCWSFSLVALPLFLWWWKHSEVGNTYCVLRLQASWPTRWAWAKLSRASVSSPTCAISRM